MINKPMSMTVTESYQAPEFTVVNAASCEVLCASKKGSTEDFELEDYEW